MSTIPGYGTYGYQQLQAERAYQQALANISSKRRGLLGSFGYSADFDEHGLARNVRIDPYSQYGQVQDMLRGDAQMADQARDDSIQRGIGSAGLGAQSENEAQLAHGAHSKQLADSLLGGLTDLTQEQTGAEQDHSNALWQIEHDAALEAIGNQDFTPAAPGTPETLPDNPQGAKKATAANPLGLTAAQRARMNKLIAQARKTPPRKATKKKKGGR